MFVKLTQITSSGQETQIAVNVNQVTQISPFPPDGTQLFMAFPEPSAIGGIHVKGTFEEVVKKLNGAT